MTHVATTSVYSKMDIRTMVTDAIRRGVDIDRPVEGSNTLLHLAVQLNLCKTVGKLLSAGADPRKENDEGHTAGSIALDNGNQMILQALSLRDEYTVHLRLFNRAQDMSSSRGSMASIASELCTIVSKMVPISMPVPYEDYMDWTDSQRCRNLQSLMESSRSEEKALRRSLEDLQQQRSRNSAGLLVLHDTLREREHGLCVQVWEAIQSERASRRAFEKATSNVSAVKELLQNALKFVHYFGIVRVAPFKKVFLKSWHRSFVEITGSALVIGSYHDETPAAGKSFSFSMSYKGSSKRRVSKTNDGTRTTSTTKRTTHDTNTGSSAVDSSDADTDGSNTAATFATTEMMAAHALGPAGLPPSPTRLHTTANTNLNSCTTYTSNTGNRVSESDTLLAPLRRQFQKLHDKAGQCRSISVQDVVAIEVCKVDKSLGAAYVQIELRIHYLKDGNALSLLMSPVPIHAASANTTVSGVGEGRERLASNTSTASGNSTNNSVRSTSNTSVSSAVSSLLSPFKNANHNSKHGASHTPSSHSKQRSTSTSYANTTPTFTPIPISTTPGTHTKRSSHLLHDSLRIPHDKLEVVWLKLPTQANTISSRAVAKGRADDTEGPVLTFELFVAILRRIKDDIRVFAVNNGVETAYRVNPPIEEHSNKPQHAHKPTVNTVYATSPAPPLMRKLSRIDSFTSPARPSRDGAHSPFGTPIAANTSFYRKVVSSGDLAALDSPSLGDRPPRPHAVIGSNTTIHTSTGTYNTVIGSNADVSATDTVSIPLPLELPQYTRCDSLNTVGSTTSISSGSGRDGTNTGTSNSGNSGNVSPKKNANSATFSSVLSLSASNSGTYPSGSVNSASGLTSLESLVVMTHRAHTSHSSASVSTSGSVSMTTSSSMSTSASIGTVSSSSMGSGSYFAAKSPRYGAHTYTHTHAVVLYEETSADIQAMLEEGEFSDHSRLQGTDDDETVRSSYSGHAPRFLKLSRRYTEGDQALNTTHNVSVHTALDSKEEVQYVTEDPTVHRTHFARAAHTTHLVTHIERGVRGCSFASTGSGAGTSVFRDVDSGDEAEGLTTRHTLGGEIGVVGDGDVVSSPGKTARSSSSVNMSSASLVPTTPPKLIPIQHPHTTGAAGAGSSKEEPVYNEQLSFSAPPVALRRDSSRTSANGGNTVGYSGTSSSVDIHKLAESPRSPRSPRKSADTNTLNKMAHAINASNTAGVDSNNISSSSDLIQHPAKLSRMLERARAKRSKIENRLVELLESREKLRETIQYLQSLRAIVDQPPPTPTRSLAKTKAPSIDKAMQLLNVYGDHINHVTEGLNTHSVSHTNSSESRGRLFDAEEFVRIMLHAGGSNGTGSGGSNSGSYGISSAGAGTAAHTFSTATHSTMHSSLQTYGSEYAQYAYGNDRESFASTSSRSATPSVSRRVGNSVNSIGTNSVGTLQQHTSSTGGVSPVHIRRLFTDDHTAHTHNMYTAQPYGALSNRNSFSLSRQSFSQLQQGQQAPSPVFPGEPTPQLLRSPPPGYKPEFIAVMSQLERIWAVELESFHCVEKLAQCLDQRGRTWQRLKALREQEQSMAVPTKQDLYDIEF